MQVQRSEAGATVVPVSYLNRELGLGGNEGYGRFPTTTAPFTRQIQGHVVWEDGARRRLEGCLASESRVHASTLDGNRCATTYTYTCCSQPAEEAGHNRRET